MARNSNKQWTPEEEKRLLEFEEAGKPRVMIAAALRRSAGSIGSRLGILRLRQTEVAAPGDAGLDGKSSP
jgi:hypothetical protein